MATRLGAPPDLDVLDGLMTVLARIAAPATVRDQVPTVLARTAGPATVRDRVERHLQVVNTLVRG